MRRLAWTPILLVALAGLPLPAQQARGGGARPASPAPAGGAEKLWRSRFREVRAGLDAVASCRARLPDFCSWEYYRSHEEPEARAHEAYLEARRRGEAVKDPLEGQVWVPEECRRLFDGAPGEIEPRADPEAPDSCLTRVTVLIEAIDRVARYWEERRRDLERRARENAVPRAWRE